MTDPGLSDKNAKNSLVGGVGLCAIQLTVHIFARALADTSGMEPNPVSAPGVGPMMTACGFAGECK